MEIVKLQTLSPETEYEERNYLPKKREKFIILNTLLSRFQKDLLL